VPARPRKPVQPAGNVGADGFAGSRRGGELGHERVPSAAAMHATHGRRRSDPAIAVPARKRPARVPDIPAHSGVGH
jgi:hypothetical protein